MLRRQHLHAIEREKELKYIGCSAQSVPSLSNTAMRSAGGTKSGAPSLVTVTTKATMDCLAGPSFQEGSGSWARTAVAPKPSVIATKLMRTSVRFAFMCSPFSPKKGTGGPLLRAARQLQAEMIA